MVQETVSVPQQFACNNFQTNKENDLPILPLGTLVFSLCLALLVRQWQLLRLLVLSPQVVPKSRSGPLKVAFSRVPRR